MDKIVDIPVKMEKYYGKGKMLHPSVETVEKLVVSIPNGYVATIDGIAKRLTKDAGTDVTCPMRTGNAIKKIANRYTKENIDYKVPFWRVIRTDKIVIKSKDFEYWATLLEDEGFNLDFSKSGNVKVVVDSDKIFEF
jgi:alkylated DNA nucleotide flippase Atl1